MSACPAHARTGCKEQQGRLAVAPVDCSALMCLEILNKNKKEQIPPSLHQTPGNTTFRSLCHYRKTSDKAGCSWECDMEMGKWEEIKSLNGRPSTPD